VSLNGGAIAMGLQSHVGCPTLHHDVHEFERTAGRYGLQVTIIERL
jgi:hypothetical protein